MKINKRTLLLSSILFVVLILLVLPAISSGINSTIKNIFYETKGESTPDSNIVIIHVTESDIENLGDWPLKRSYYALLIDKLTKLNVKRVGLEIFISENISSQNIYNSVLMQAIERSENIVLASIAENFTYRSDSFNADKIILPLPALTNSEIKTGHINFLEDEGIIIPNKIELGNTLEQSFSNVLSEKESYERAIKLNVNSNWRKFQNFSILEFFDLAENNPNALSNFEDKYILIGVSATMVAKSIESNFNEELPGVALHAFALDNLINGRSIIYQFASLSKYFFWILAIVLAYFGITNKNYILILLSSLVVFFVLFSYIQIELDYTSLVLPVFSLLIVNSIFDFVKNKSLLDQSKIESDELRESLNEKENLLSNLKSELEVNKNPNEGLELKIDELEAEILKLKKAEADDKSEFIPSKDAQNFEGIVYRSSKMQKITGLIKKVAPETAAILVMGESGSGKELVANAIHNLSDRKEKPFVAVNCAALPDNLLESELFGHVKGAFTDAIKDKIGRFEEANNGTLFLDEIGETSENFQVKLLRVLQSGDFQKVGSSETSHADVRLVAATNKNLHKLVKEGEFREDLYYRLNVINIELPSLNERSEDVEILAEYFMKKEETKMSFSKAVITKLVENEWKGNVRELESTVKRAVIFAKSDNRTLIKLKDLPENLAKFDKDELESMIIDSLRDKKFSHSSINETAKELGGLNRTVITENYRGYFFKVYFQNNFDLEKSINIVSDSSDEEINSKVRSKVTTYLTNVEKDLSGIEDKSFEEIKTTFSSKYKNLPQKYHIYLDNVIKNLIKN